jgi:hypothetical protein
MEFVVGKEEASCYPPQAIKVLLVTACPLVPLEHMNMLIATIRSV